MPSVRATLLPALATACLAVASAAPAQAAEVVTLTQVACQFLEPEGVDRDFQTAKKADCQAINARTGRDRLDKATVMKLKPGDYVFRVTNKDVPYGLGFWLREKDYDWRNPVHKVTKVSVSGGGLLPGVTKDYKVTLKPGEYVFSCPLNPTPNYRVVVGE